jgi:hypothetical protein
MTNAFVQSLCQLAADLKAERDLRHPYVVKQNGMTRLNLGEDHFQAMNSERRRWLRDNCSGSVAFDQLPLGAGQEYRFESLYDAVDFMMHFGTRLFPSPDR